jgi:serine/threonine-protein kinase
VKIKLVVIDGPHKGVDFTFDGRDSFLVGRTKDSHFRLSYDDPYFSRRHFVIDLNPPRCRLLDLKSRNGVYVNGQRVEVADLVEGDRVKAGHTVFLVEVRDDGGTPPCDTTVSVPARSDSGTEIEHSSPLVPGYRLDGELGRGGMGVVYRATRLADGHPAAVKVLLPAAGSSRRDIDLFLREARVLAALTHPHIVRCLETGEGEGFLFIAMELLDGPDLKRVVVDGGPQPVSLAVQLIRHALIGLQAAHAAGYVHRDVKPPNLLLGREGDRRIVKLADFGLAKAFESSRLTGITLHGDIGGTPAFMAPEQITHYKDARPAADQSAAAASLYYLLTGKYVFDFPAAPAGWVVTIATERPIPIRQRRPEIPEELARVIHKALGREPADRYQDVGEFRAALAPFEN